MKQWYPTLGATTAGATAGILGGGPLAIGLASGGGALAGEVAKGNAEIEEARETISALTHGDVEALSLRKAWSNTPADLNHLQQLSNESLSSLS